MFPSLQGISAGSTVLKWLIIVGVIAVPAAAAGYGVGVFMESKKTLAETNKVLEKETKITSLLLEVSDAKLQAVNEIRAAEAEASVKAEALEKRLSQEAERSRRIRSDYAKKLQERKEVPGRLTSSAVDTINQIVSGVEVK